MACEILVSWRGIEPTRPLHWKAGSLPLVPPGKSLKDIRSSKFWGLPCRSLECNERVIKGHTVISGSRRASLRKWCWRGKQKDEYKLTSCMGVVIFQAKEIALAKPWGQEGAWDVWGTERRPGWLKPRDPTWKERTWKPGHQEDRAAFRSTHC